MSVAAAVLIKPTARRRGNQEPTTHIFKEGAESAYNSPILKRNIHSWVSKPFPWQELVYHDLFALTENGSLQYKTVCLSVPRRNGKTEIILGIMVIFSIMYNAKTLYTAQVQDTADDVYSRFMDLIESRKSRLHLYFPGIQRKSKVSEEVVQAYNPKTGRPLGTLEFRGRRGDKGRGVTRDVLIIDEAQDYDAAEEQRFGSINGSSELGLTFLVGTPPPLDSKTDKGSAGAVFRQLREEALAEKDLPWEARQKRGTAWIEWGSDSVKDKLDRDSWYRYNPSMGYLPKNALSEDWFENRPSSAEVFSVENLGYWGSQSKDRAVDISVFNRLAVSGKDLMVGLEKAKYSISLKSDLSESCIHLGAAFMRDDQKIAYQHLQTVYVDEAGWDKKLEGLLTALIKNQKCVSAMIDGSLAKSAALPVLIRNGLWNARKSKVRQGKVIMTGMTEMASACASLLTAVSSRRLVHSAPPPLHAAAEDAQKRKIGESGFGFQGISGLVDVIPLEVCALALYGIESHGQKRPLSDIQIKDKLKLAEETLGAL